MSINKSIFALKKGKVGNTENCNISLIVIYSYTKVAPQPSFW